MAQVPPPTPLELDTARAALAAVRRWAEDPANPAVARGEPRDYYLRHVALGLEVLAALAAPPVPRFRVISSKSLGLADENDPFSAQSRKYEVECRPGWLKFLSQTQCSGDVYSYPCDTEVTFTGDAGCAPTAEKLAAWLAGFTAQVADLTNCVWFAADPPDSAAT